MNRMNGVINGCYSCNHERVDEINDRMYERNVPSTNLQPQYSIRPVATKYGYMEVLNQYKKPTVDLNSYPTYSVNNTFNPGNNMAPWSGFSNNVNLESELRNQFFALQKCDQAKYIPSSKSDLYNVTVDYTKVNQTHPLLFESPDFKPFNPNSLNLAGNLFNNHTRYQLKDSKPDDKNETK